MHEVRKFMVFANKNKKGPYNEKSVGQIHKSGHFLELS